MKLQAAIKLQEEQEDKNEKKNDRRGEQKKEKKETKCVVYYPTGTGVICRIHIGIILFNDDPTWVAN